VDITAFLTQSSVLVIAGKGGAGKTTVSAALARLAARNGLSVLLVELAGRRATSAAHGHDPQARNQVELSSAGPRDRLTPPAQIRARALSPEGALVEYLTDHGFRRAARRLANSAMLDVVATAIPGIRDVLVLGKIVQLERAGTADLIVVDGPAAGHAITFLTSAQGLLGWSRAGPVHAQAADVAGLLSDPARCRVVLVTLAEETPVNEIVETAFNLQAQVGTHFGPVIVNGLYPRLDHLDADPDDAAAAAGVILGPDQAEAMWGAAVFRRRREEMQAEQADRLAEAVPLPQVWLPHLFTGEIGRPEMDLLIDALETGLVKLREPPRRAGWTGSSEPASGDRVPARAAAAQGSLA
jgi:anion-transporting  ArsA/GET3 family ATPase